MSTSNGRMASQLVPLNTDITKQQRDSLQHWAERDGNKVAHQVRSALDQYANVRAGKSTAHAVTKIENRVEEMTTAVERLTEKVLLILQRLDHLERQQAETATTLGTITAKLTELAERKKGFWS